MSIINHPLAQALAWALVHFVWQGAAIALAAFAVMRIGRMSASARYITGVVAMAAMLVAPAITFARLTAAPPAPDAAVALSRETVASRVEAPGREVPATPSASASQAPAPGTMVSSFTSLAPTVILVLWCSGVVILSLRLIGGWFVARRLARRSTLPVTPEIQALARRIAGRLALDRIVGVFESTAVSVPVMIGWMKPVVLLPAAALSGLSVEQVEALLAHELAHVRRHDYLVNLLQSAVETLLFYHPAVWWVSTRMRVDRELCCDDIALEVCDRMVYATALSDLAAMTTAPRMALAATDGPLLNRVRRILGQPVDRQDSGSGWLSALLVVMLIGSIAPSALTSSSEPQETGVASGVVVGVQSGVAGGVVSSVVGGVQEPGQDVRPVEEVASEQARTSAQTEEARKVAQAAAARARQIEMERHEIEMARIDNEFRHMTDQSAAQLAGLELDLKSLRQQHERAKELLQKNLVQPGALTELESKIARAEQAIASEKAETDYRQESLMLKRREVELDHKAGLERRMEATSSAEADMKARIDEVAKARGNEESRSMADTVTAARMSLSTREQLDREWSAAVVSSPTEPVRAGDILGIIIHNEPDLPHSFVVQSDGTIRFPLVGAIRVQGLTARQVHDALAKQLADRKLATGSGIEVTLRRPRTPETGR